MIALYILIGLAVFGLGFGWIFASIVFPLPDTDEIEEIGRWAKEELDRRERKKNDQCR